MSSNKFIQWFGIILRRSIFHLAIPITSLTTLFCLVYGTANADLSTIPPLKVQKEQQTPIQTKIESLLVKARTAISKKRFTLPENNNAIYYLDQLLVLSPDNKPAQSALIEVYDICTRLAYRKLNKNNIKLAQKYHNNAEKIADQFNINIDTHALIDLQNKIDTRQAKILKFRATQKKRIAAKKNKKKKQMLTELADLQREIALSQLKMAKYKTKLKTHTRENKPTEKIAGANIETTKILTEQSFLSPAEREEIVVIVNKKNNVSSLTLNQLKSLYKEQKKTWPNGEIVTLYLPSADSDEFLWLARNVFLKKSPASVIQFYMKGLNRNKLKMPATSINSILDVSRIAGSIAIIKAGETEGHDSIKIITINGT